MFTRCPQQARPAFLRQPRSQRLIKSRLDRSPLAVVDSFLSSNSTCSRFTGAKPASQPRDFLQLPFRSPLATGSSRTSRGHSPLPLNSFRIRSYGKSARKSFRFRSYEKHPGVGVPHLESLNAINDLQLLFYRTLRLAQPPRPLCEQPPSTSVPRGLESILYPQFYCSWSPRQTTLAFH